MSKFQEHIGNNIKELNFENEQNWQREINNHINSIITHCEKEGLMPFMTFLSCNCGCGAIYDITNNKIISKQQSIKMLEDCANKIKEELKNIN